MHLSASILADHDIALIKFAVFAIFAILWGIKAIANLAQPKQKLPTNVAPPRLPPARPRPPMPPRLPNPAVRRNPIPAHRVPAVARAQVLPPLLQAVTKKVAVPHNLPAIPVAPKPPARVQKKPAAAPTQAATPSRASIARWVNAGTLRSQFILAEALKPPIALREKSHLA